MNQDAIRKAYRAGYHVDDDGQILTAAGTTLRPSTDRRGYLFVRILLDGRLMYLPIHRLCAYQKYGEQLFTAYCVRHLDGNQLNNRPDNLSLGSHSQNMMDRPYRTRRALALNASRHQLSYHSDEEVSAIKEFYRHTRSYQRTMQHFGLTSKGTLFYMLNRR
jgi:hypothetical protein